MQAIAPQLVDLGGLTVRRLLPRAARRLVGPWCFLDEVGPLAFEAGRRIDVPPHPHIGLQTVTWLLEGEMRHRDSLGGDSVARPGTLHLMTAGRGIAHAEESPEHATPRVHALQLWIALPESHRETAPAFEAHVDRPMVACDGARVAVILGELAGIRAEGRTFSPLVAADITLAGAAEIPLTPDFEHGLLPLSGEVVVEGERLERHHLYYFAPGAPALRLQVWDGAEARVLLLGGAPFGERIVMWWNFVARAPEEIAAAREDWQAGRRFGEVRGYPGARLDAPPLRGRPVAPNAMS